MANFREVLKNRNFVFLWFAQIISQIGDRLHQMALIGFVYELMPGSSLQLAKILSFTILPVFFIGPIAGVYVDRWDRRRTMFAADFLRAGLVLLIPLFFLSRSGLTWLYLLIFLIFSIGRFFVPAKLSIIPDLVKKEQLIVANSLVNTTGMIAAIAGFGIAGLIVERLGSRGGFYLDAFTFFISAVLIFLISTRKAATVKIKEVGKEIVEVIEKSVVREIKEGLKYFIQKKEMRFTGAVMSFLGGAGGAVYIVIIVFVQEVLKSATFDLGFLIVFLGVGLFLGALFYGRFCQKISHYRVIFVSLTLAGFILGAFALSLSRWPDFVLAAVFSFILGLSVSPIIIICNTLIHHSSRNEMMGRIFSFLEFLMHLSFIIFMFFSSFLAEHICPVVILVCIAVIFIIVGSGNLILARKSLWLD
ncbi:MAG: MFS transporter [Candidatus Omnitrophica bacterium]|nr:MFS transporter [Candidatus Omnitrophota bacterium]